LFASTKHQHISHFLIFFCKSSSDLAKFSIKFLFEFNKKKASLVADFSHTQGKNPIIFINFFSDSGMTPLFK
jgi:hypothetical protein